MKQGFALAAVAAFGCLPFFAGPISAAAEASDLSFLSAAEQKIVEKNPDVTGRAFADMIWPTDGQIRDSIEKTLAELVPTLECAEPRLASFEKPHSAMLDRLLEAAFKAGQIKHAWFTNVQVENCGAQHAWKMVLLQKPDDSYLATLLLQGETYVWLALKNTVAQTVGPAVVAKAQAAGGNCAADGGVYGHDAYVTDDKKVGPRLLGVRLKGTWTERWVMRACGKLVPLDISFKPDGKGGTGFQAAAGQVTSR